MMVEVHIMEPTFNKALWNARRTMPVEQLETPRQYGRRWREEFKCRATLMDTYVFDRDEDYTWFMLRWG